MLNVGEHKVCELHFLVAVQQSGAEDGHNSDGAMLCVVMKAIYVVEHLLERHAEHHAVHGPEGGVGRGLGSLGHANVQKAGAGVELLQNGEILGERKVGLH